MAFKTGETCNQWFSKFPQLLNFNSVLLNTFLEQMRLVIILIKDLKTRKLEFLRLHYVSDNRIYFKFVIISSQSVGFIISCFIDNLEYKSFVGVGVQTHICLASKPLILYQPVISNESNYQQYHYKTLFKKKRERIHIFLLFTKYLLTMGK